MKNFFKKFRSYSFWVSLSGAVIILLNALSRLFGFEIENQVVEDVIMSVAGVFVVLGIVVYDKNSNSSENDDEENLNFENTDEIADENNEESQKDEKSDDNSDNEKDEN